MDGILRCSRYAFGPNRLHYCGPDKNRDIHGYINAGVEDPGLAQLLAQFRTMYPYLRVIAEANHIRDPFDERVVEAYWIGNEFLDAVPQRAFHRHLVEVQRIPERIGKRSFSYVERKIGQGAVPHHAFHVLDIWKRTGHLEKEHTLESMDECRVSWGKVVAAAGPVIEVETEPLIYMNGKLKLGAPVKRKLPRRLEAEYDIEQVKPGEWVSIHWGVPCEVLAPRQVANLKKYTLRHLALANQTI